MSILTWPRMHWTCSIGIPLSIAIVARVRRNLWGCILSIPMLLPIVRISTLFQSYLLTFLGCLSCWNLDNNEEAPLPRGANNARVVSAIAFLHGKVLFLQAYPDFRMQTGSGLACSYPNSHQFCYFVLSKTFLRYKTHPITYLVQPKTFSWNQIVWLLEFASGRTM